MWLTTTFISSLFITSFDNQAIVIRHDVSDEKYHADISAFPPLATLYKIGVHGTLIHPEWVVTAGHAVFCMEQGDKIKVGGHWATVSSRYTHAKYHDSDNYDISLLKLATPINNIVPAELYRNDNEAGQKIWFVGSGSTGNGLTGQTVNYVQNKGLLRKAENTIDGVSDTELFFTFNKGPKALPLEGVSGNADSGGPAYQKIDNKYYLLGISSRADSPPEGIGKYGVKEIYSRISFHIDWIEKVISEDQEHLANLTSQYHFADDNLKSNLSKVCAQIGY